MSFKPDSTKHHSLASLFNGIATIGDVFGTELDDLRHKHSLRMRLQRGYTDHSTWFAEIAVVETKVRAALGANQVEAIKQWLKARQVLTGILTGLNRLEGITLAQATQRMLRAGLIRIARTRTAANFLDQTHEHVLPQSLLVDALAWFAHPSRIDNKSVKDFKAPWNLGYEMKHRQFLDDERTQPNPQAGQPMACTSDMLQQVIDVIKELEHVTLEGGIKKGHLCFGKVAGPLMPLASLSPTKDGMQMRRRRGHAEAKMGKMTTEQFVELKNYSDDGTIYVMRITSLKGRISVQVCLRNVYLGAGQKLPDGRVDYSKQTRLQKGTTRRVGNDWVDQWQPLPPSRRLDRGDGDIVTVWQPFAMYEDPNNSSTKVDKLSDFLARMGAECDGIIGLSWGQKRGDEEVFLSMIRQVPAGAELLTICREEMLEDLQVRQEAAAIAKAAVQKTTATPEMLADQTAHHAEAVLAGPSQEEADPSAFLGLLEQHAPAGETEGEAGEDMVMHPVAAPVATTEEPAVPEHQDGDSEPPAVDEEDDDQLQEEDHEAQPAAMV